MVIALEVYAGQANNKALISDDFHHRFETIAHAQG